MSASKLIFYFSSCPATDGFWASLPPDNITLNPANKRTNESLSDFQTHIGKTVHATIETEQLISHTRTALLDKSISLRGSDGGLIAASVVHGLLTVIHDIVGSAMSKWSYNMACILTYLAISKLFFQTAS